MTQQDKDYLIEQWNNSKYCAEHCSDEWAIGWRNPYWWFSGDKQAMDIWKSNPQLQEWAREAFHIPSYIQIPYKV